MDNVQFKVKIVKETAKVVKSGKQKAGLYPIAVRKFGPDTVTYDETNDYYIVSADVMAEIPATAVEVVLSDKLVVSGTTVCRPALSTKDLIDLLNSADDLAARAAVGPWSVEGQGRIATEQKIREVCDRNAELLMEFTIGRMRDGLEPITGSVAEIRNSPEYLEWARAR